MVDSPAQTDVTAVPRFANVATFMRSQLRDTPEGLDIAMFGVPLDLGSSFRTGARHGPAQIREMSRLIREVNYSTKIAPFDLCGIADIGDAPVNSLDLDASLRSIQRFVQTVLSAGARPLAIGGDHTISLPILRSMAADEALGAADAAKKARRIVAGSDCYLTFDIDALDPGVAPGVGGLEPGGISVRQAQVFLRELRGIPIVGADVVEVSPPLDPSGGTALVAANLMFEMLCLLAECHGMMSG